MNHNSAFTSLTDPKINQYGSHMIMTNVVKEPKTKLISIDTKFADECKDPNLANFTFKLPERITGIQSLSVSSVRLPITFYNISAVLQNNSFQLLVEGVSVITSTTITIPDGNYTLSSLETAIKLVIPAYLGFSLFNSGNQLNSTFSFTATSTYRSLKIVFGLPEAAGVVKPLAADSAVVVPEDRKVRIKCDDNPRTIKLRRACTLTDTNSLAIPWDAKSGLGWLLGFRKSSYLFKSTYPGNVASTVVSEGLANINSLTYLFLVLDEFSGSSQSSSFHAFVPDSLMNRPILAQVLIDHTLPFGGVQNATINNGGLVSDKRQYYGDRVDLQKCQVSLVNEFGRVVSLNQNDFSFVIELGVV